MAVFLSLLFGCPQAEPTPTADTDPMGSACSAACADPSDEGSRQRCYACQCREAMDGWLPSVEELQCENGAEIEVYTTLPSGERERAGPGATTCANPSLLYGTCNGGGRLGQLTVGTVTAKWICRYNGPVDQPGVDPYDDVGLILYNSRNGASCWFDDEDGTGLADGNFPDVDLEASDAANSAAYSRFFRFTTGAECVECHDADPFIYTPYLESVGWQTGAHVSGDYRRVGLQGLLPADGLEHLVSPEAAACRTCHRLGSRNSCAAWLADSLGAEKLDGHEAAVLQAPGTDRWWLATWMPFVAGQPLDRDEQAWEATFGLARDTVLRCCADPEAPGCLWETVP